MGSMITAALEMQEKERELEDKMVEKEREVPEMPEALELWGTYIMTKDVNMTGWEPGTEVRVVGKTSHHNSGTVICVRTSDTRSIKEPLTVNVPSSGIMNVHTGVLEPVKAKALGQVRFMEGEGEDYLTKGKLYDVVRVELPRLGYIIDDVGDEIPVNIIGERSIHGNTVWEYFSPDDAVIIPEKLEGTNPKLVIVDDPMQDKESPQVGGDHYAKYPIEPIRFIMENKVPFCEANVIKYIMRHKDKNGVEDLEKAKQYIDFLIAKYA